MKANSTTHPRVAVAMSGGVDSSVSASLLLDAGYDVFGITLSLWNAQDPVPVENHKPERYEDAEKVARHLGIPWHLVEMQDRFKKDVVEYYTTSLKEGLTPNPCILCNKNIKWKGMLEIAFQKGADYLATGHYARVVHGLKSELHKAASHQKDQSYFLSILGQAELSHTLFPLGEYTKEQVRKLARERDLPVAERPESQDLCFMGSLDQTEFIQKFAPGIIKPGDIYHADGRLLGSHPGLVFYTVGQRKGIAIAQREPLYVIRKEMETNRLIVGEENLLGSSGFESGQVNWVEEEPPGKVFPAQVKIRYRASEKQAVIHVLSEQRIRIETNDLIRDITPGQAVVMYQDDHCLGMGFIE